MAEPSGSGAKTGVPVFVMLPLEILNGETNAVEYARTPSTPLGSGPRYDKFKTDQEKWLLADLDRLREADVQGVMVDCWWGIVEAKGPGQYNWDGYENLFSIVKEANLELHAVMSFHKCGGNVGDTVTIPLPKWVTLIGDTNSDIYYKDRSGSPDDEYLSLGIDNIPVLHGHTALQVYESYMQSFKSKMYNDYLKPGIITGIEVGLGPCGELRYPSYQQSKGWKPLNMGEFQCEDEYMKKSLATMGQAQGWGAAPQDAGTYNSNPQETPFFKDGGGYSIPYGKFFLSWYSGKLIEHGGNVMQRAKGVFNDVEIAAKVPGIHWYCGTKSRAAEATAGLFAADPEDELSVYRNIAEELKSVNATFIFTCAEMKDDPHNASDKPGRLVEQVLGVAQESKVSRACENALPIATKKSVAVEESQSYDQIIDVATKYNISYFTYLRLCPGLMDEERFGRFQAFVKGMKGIGSAVGTILTSRI